jgi:hypothetical protein
MEQNALYTKLAMPEFFSISVNSSPYPAIFFFEPMYVCISSNATIFAGAFVLRSSTPKDRIHLRIATVLNFNTRPIALSPFNDSTFAIVSFFAFWTIHLNAPRLSGLIYFYCTKKIYQGSNAIKSR